LTLDTRSTVAACETQPVGVEVRIDIPPLMPDSRSALEAELQAVGIEPFLVERRDMRPIVEAAILVYLTAKSIILSDQVATALENWARRFRVRGKDTPQHLAVIYGPDGKVIKGLEIPDDDGDDGDGE
jgi:hypothetical protein